MNKRLFLLLSAAAVNTAMIVGAVACSSDNTPSSFNNEQPDATTFDQGPGFVQDGNVTGQDAPAPVVCDPSLPATFVPSWKAPAKQSACTNDDINGYHTACIASLDNPDAGTTCETWKAGAANATCAACIETADNNGPIQFYQKRAYFAVNVAGCLSIERGETADGLCPAAYSQSFDCQRASCDECFKDPNADFDDFKGCEAKAKTSACATYEAKKNTACGATTNTPDGGVDCFPLTNEQPDDYYKRSIAKFCLKD